MVLPIDLVLEKKIITEKIEIERIGNANGNSGNAGITFDMLVMVIV